MGKPLSLSHMLRLWLPLRRLSPLPHATATAAAAPSCSALYRSSASPLVLPSAFDAQDDGEGEGAAAEKDSRVARAIVDLFKRDSYRWSPQLESSLSALSPNITQAVVVRALDLLNSPPTALRFFRWAQRRRVPLDDRAHFKMLQVLCRRGNLSPAMEFLHSLDCQSVASGDAVALHDRFFNVLIRAYGRSGQVREAIGLFRRMRDEFGIQPSVFSFNSLLTVLLRRGRTESARKLFDEMVRPKGGHAASTPDVCTFNILIRGFCLNSMVDLGFRFFKEMKQWDCEPDILTYNTLLHGLCCAGKVRIAHNLLNGMRTKGPALKPNVISYTTVIRGYCGKRRIDEALDLCREMVSSGIQPSNISYNTLIQGLCEARGMDLIKEIIKLDTGANSEGNLKPDTCTFNTLITAYCNMGCVEDALKVFAKMAEMKVKSDSATYSILIRALCQKEDFERAEALLDVVLEKEVLTRKGGSTRVMAAYNPILEYLCHNGKAQKASRLFLQLLAKGTLDMASCKTMILGHCREGAPSQGYQIVVEMVRRDLMPDQETYEVLIEGLLANGDMGCAWKALGKMLGSGHRPKASIFHLVLTGLLRENVCVREACDLVTVMLERKVRQSVDLSTKLVAALFESGSNDMAFEILGLLYGNGYGVKMEELVGFLCQSRKLLEARDLLLFCLKQQQQQQQQQSLGVEVHGMVVKELCQIGRASEAFELFYELSEKKVSLDSSCLEELEVALGTEGRQREAKFVSKRSSKASVDT